MHAPSLPQGKNLIGALVSFLADGNFSPLRGSPSFGLGLAASGFGT